MRSLMGLLTMLFGLNQGGPVFANTDNMIILDVRTPEEFSDTHVEGAKNFDIFAANFKDQISKLDKNKNYKVYCRSGNRSGQAERLMKSMGFKDVENIGSVAEAARRLNKKCSGKTC